MTGRHGVLLCDADGNLFPSEEPAFDASVQVTNDLLAALGIEIRFTAQELRLATTGKNFRTTAADLVAAHGLPPLPPKVLQDWVEREQAAVTAHLAQVLSPDTSVREPLIRLAREHVLAVVTSSAKARVQACLQATQLDALLPADAVYSAEDSLLTPTSKPDPAIYLHACAALGAAPAAAIAVEDSIPGAQSAVRAGIPTIGNLQFVPLSERQEREAALREVGVIDVVLSWADLEQVLARRPEGVP